MNHCATHLSVDVEAAAVAGQTKVALHGCLLSSRGGSRQRIVIQSLVAPAEIRFISGLSVREVCHCRVETNPASVHVTLLARRQLYFPPLARMSNLIFDFELEDLAGFHLGNNCTVLARAGSNVSETVRVINDSAERESRRRQPDGQA